MLVLAGIVLSVNDFLRIVRLNSKVLVYFYSLSIEEHVLY